VARDVRLSRRKLLATLGGASAVAAAGCSSSGDDDGGDDDGGDGGTGSDGTGSGNGDGSTDGEGTDTETENLAVEVETHPPTTVGSRSGRLNGELDEMGGYGTVDCYFQYRRAGTGWQSTERQSRSSPGEYSQKLSDLATSAEYEFRAVGNPGGGTVTGETRTFETRPNPNTATITADSLTLFSADDGTKVAQIRIDNEGGDNSAPITLEITWYDEERLVLGTDTVGLETLRPGETWLAQVTPGNVDGAEVASVTANTTVDGEPPDSPSGVRVTGTALRTGEYPTQVTGVVENTHDEAVDVEAIARVFDEEGNVVADRRASMRNVSAGDTRPFSATFVGRDADRIDGTFDHGVLLDV